MAKVNIEFDTLTKKMVCKMDGSEMSNVVGCNLGRGYSDEEEYHCDLIMMEKDKPNDMTKFTRISASEQINFKFKPENKSDKLLDELKNYFGK